MTMRLAQEEIIIMHAGNPVRMRPSLRAACILETRYGLMKVAAGIGECNLQIIETLIAETAVDPIAARRLLVATVDATGIRQLQHLASPLFDILFACYGIGDDPAEGYQAERKEQAGKYVSVIEALATLYQIATGWLGWTPDQALAASPAQITEAHKGFVAKQRALSGIPDDAEQIPQYDPRNLPSDAEIADGVARLKAMQ